MTDLIVEFPQFQRRKSSSDEQAARGVRFCPTVDIRFIERHDRRNASEMFYSEKEYAAMEVANKRAARKANRKLASMSRRGSDSSSSTLDSSSASSLDSSTASSLDSSTASSLDYSCRHASSPADDIDMAGLENLLSSKICAKISLSKQLCWRAVFLEQAMQDELGEHDPHRLARVYANYSKWSAKRAYAIGILQSQS